MPRPTRLPILVTGLVVILAATTASAASAAKGQVTITPQNGQSADVMAKDQAECSASATSATGYDPAAATKPASGGRLAGAAKGAALGAAGAEMRGRANGGELYEHANDHAKEEYRQNNAKDAAKVGAAVGGMQQRRDRRETAATAEAWDKSFRGCLTSRGYAVK